MSFFDQNLTFFASSFIAMLRATNLVVECAFQLLIWLIGELISSSISIGSLNKHQLAEILLTTCNYYKLGDSWNYMPPIFVPSSAKRISRRISVIEKLSGRKDFIWEAFFMILFVSARNYLFKFSNWRPKIRCESCSKLRMKILERYQNVILVFLLLTVNIFQALL